MESACSPASAGGALCALQQLAVQEARAIDLSSQSLTDQDLAALSPRIQNNSALTDLTLALGANSPAATAAFLAPLVGHPTLATLCLVCPLDPPPPRHNYTSRKALLQVVTALGRLARECPSLVEISVPEDLLQDSLARGHWRRIWAVLDERRRLLGMPSKKTRASEWTPLQEENVPPPEVTPLELLQCAGTLRKLAAHKGRDLFKSPLAAGVAAVQAEANRLVAALKRARSLTVHSPQRHLADRQYSLQATWELPTPQPVIIQEAAPRFRCYICNVRCRLSHPAYHSLCMSCGEVNFQKRQQRGDLAGWVAVVTGGRVKIGYHVVLKLLRAGAFVEVTTRFPIDAAKRYATEPDFKMWRSNLRIHGLDLRDLAAVGRFASAISSEYRSVDVVINCAAQTIQRPPGWSARLLQGELHPLPDVLAGLVASEPYHVLPKDLIPLLNGAGVRQLRDPSDDADDTLRQLAAPSPAALLSQLSLVPGDLEPSQLAAVFPPGGLAEDGQQLDRRPENSWSMSLEDVSPWELLEVHYVNALAPFVLVQRLLPLLRQSPQATRHVVNVSAMEGKFDYRSKTPRHPHTNMAKAALNMLTRTAGPALALENIYMVSVDTGWVTNEQPCLVAERMRESGFCPPLDEIDGAARVLDPVFAAAANRAKDSGPMQPLHSVFLKDYKPTTW